MFSFEGVPFTGVREEGGEGGGAKRASSGRDSVGSLQVFIISDSNSVFHNWKEVKFNTLNAQF